MEERGMRADTADFEIFGNDLNALAFRTENVKSEIDFDDRIGDFVHIFGVTQIDLQLLGISVQWISLGGLWT